MSKVMVYGASDDLIEVEGDVKLEDGSYDRPGFIHFPDVGAVLKVEYSPSGYDGRWKIDVVNDGGLDISIEPSGDADSANYSDKATVTGAFDAGAIFKCDTAEGASVDMMASQLEDFTDWRSLDEDELREIWSALQGWF